ncbi:SMI1/KNR4 family protein [Janthinobacterium sp. SUN073]|uniref:SMI1/KNR4 family protein n=1 Tax=Janthinobacterium sp. SUN073 TaxID=3004102 RepID=UPI0025B1DB2B|nr:SMI1/KNR4 family protein [Janthinobacterium sp. SUN073]MDN2697125.1 SMI1/KNR4 family protein [Janthinobacterium sp. SUN073]
MTGITTESIIELEVAIGSRLPDDVRSMYGLSNGYKGPTDCQLLYRADADSGIVSMNRLKEEAWFPKQFPSLVLVGDNGCGSLIGFDWATGKAILWNPADGDMIQESRDSVTEIWDYVINLYETISRQD